MNEANRADGSASDPPQAEVRPRRGISLVWLIPLVALAIGGFLAYKAYSSRGPTVTITFDTAEGLEAGKTKVRYLDVEVGTVQAVAIAPGLKNIVVTAEMVPAASEYLRTGTAFWIVKPRIGVGGVSGLGTLLSGAYIGLAPGEGESAREFTGLEDPPPISANVPGREYVLTAPNLGSVTPGAPIYYRGIDIGQVLGYELNADAHSLDISIFIREPYTDLVHVNSRFWNASGIDFATTASGVELQVASLQALLIGGIEVDTPITAQPTTVADAGARFPLYPNQRALAQAQFTAKIPYLVYFDGSVRGLSPGAPVEFRGITVGTVTSIGLEFDPKQARIRIPVTIEIEPQRLIPDVTQQEILGQQHRNMAELVRRGLRAQLQTGNLLTGELFVDLTFVPDAAPAELDTTGQVPIIPSVPATLEALQASATAILNKLASMPVEDLIVSLNKAAAGLDRIVNAPELQTAAAGIGPAIADLRQIIAKLDAASDPLLGSLTGAAETATATMRDLQGTAASLQKSIGAGSALTNNAENMMQELTRAARSIRVLADYLERNPDALLRGKSAGASR
ncbi:MAG: intermembrane transport protein PqiB [Geminicoccaceae bacterium]